MAKTCRWSPRTGWSWSPGACEVGSSLGPWNVCLGPHGNPSGTQLISKEKTEEFLICEEDQEAKLLGWAQAGSRYLVELGKEANSPRLLSGNPS